MFERTKERIHRVKENSYSVGDTVDEIVDIVEEDAVSLAHEVADMYLKIRETIRNRNVKRDNDD